LIKHQTQYTNFINLFILLCVCVCVCVCVCARACARARARVCVEMQKKSKILINIFLACGLRIICILQRVIALFRLRTSKGTFIARKFWSIAWHSYVWLAPARFAIGELPNWMSPSFSNGKPLAREAFVINYSIVWPSAAYHRRSRRKATTERENKQYATSCTDISRVTAWSCVAYGANAHVDCVR